MTEYIRAEFGVVYESDRSYHYLLKHLGFSSSGDVRRDDQAVEQTIGHTRKDKALYGFGHMGSMSRDPSRLRRRNHAGIGSKDPQAIPPEEGQHYFGALNLKTGRHHLIPLDWQDTNHICQALTMIKKKYPDKRICIFGITLRGTKQKPCESN